MFSPIEEKSILKKNKSPRLKKPFLLGVVGVVAFFSVWMILSLYKNNSVILPTPWAVLKKIAELVQTKAFFLSVGVTLGRVLLSFFITACVSFLCGLWWGLNKKVYLVFSPFLTFVKSTPVISLILLAVFWFGAGVVPVFAACLMTFPLLTEAAIFRIGLLPPEYNDVAKVYGFSFFRKIKSIVIPWFLPVFIATSKTVLSQTWKIIVAAEVITMPQNAVGTSLQLAKSHIELEEVFAWTFSVVFFSGVLDVVYQKLTRKWSVLK